MVNRRFLYWGVFFVAGGSVLLAAQAALVTPDGVRAALQLWPVVVMAIGAALLLRRTRLGLAGGVIAAALPGLLLGGVVVAAPDVRTDCHVVEPASYATRSGSFSAPARVSVELSCGDVEVGVSPGSDWQVRVGNTGAADPRIVATADQLSVRSASRSKAFSFHGGDVWRVSLPDAQPLDLSAAINAGRGRFALAGARLGSVDLDINAGEGTVDLTGATVGDLTLHVNAASATVTLPGGSDLVADISANAGKVTVCAPADLGLSVRQTVVLGSTRLTGLARNGDAWQSANYASTTHHADVTLSVNVGSVDINPEGGCK